MSLPPVTVRIKRKATDEPVDYLRVQEANGNSKRRQLKADFIFSRQVEPMNESTRPSDTVPGAVRPIKEPRISLGIETNGLPASNNGANHEAELGTGTLGTGANIQADGISVTASGNRVTHKPRKFHISRKVIPTTPNLQSFSGRIQKQKQKQPTVFVERRARPKNASGGSTHYTPAETPEPESSLPVFQPVSTPFLTSEPAVAPPRKKPGLAARISSANVTPKSIEPLNARLPSGLMAPWSMDDQQFVDAMQAYTLEEISKNIAEAESTKPGPGPAPSPSKKLLKFKPKISKLRYHERYPEEFAKHDNEMEGEELVEEMDDDSEYIIDTYIRIPADYMEVDNATEKNMGFLVLEGELDIEEFYNNDIDTDEEDDYDEEDENAENHYSADYPDDEVDSDDEYGRNPYKYVNDDEATFSDDEDGTKYPWTQKKPAWLTKGRGESEGGDDEDSDDDNDDE